ncbi:MAG: hypothetical protein HYR92_05135 [Burkholderiales bacterium]|nr:hypothetical protein [Burkholderiales bacterium]
MLLRCCAPLLLALLTSIHQTSAASPDTQVYKCKEGERVVFKQTPCAGEASGAITIHSHQPSLAEQKAAQTAQQTRLKESNRLQKIRERIQAKDEASYRSAMKQAANARKQCESLKMKAQWAKEDLKNTQPRGEMKAQTKLKRAQQRADLICAG